MDIIIENIPYLGEKIKNRPNLKKITENITWLFLDKVVRMGVGLFVGIFSNLFGNQKFHFKKE